MEHAVHLLITIKTKLIILVIYYLLSDSSSALKHYLKKVVAMRKWSFLFGNMKWRDSSRIRSVGSPMSSGFKKLWKRSSTRLLIKTQIFSALSSSARIVKILKVSTGPCRCHRILFSLKCYWNMKFGDI